MVSDVDRVLDSVYDAADDPAGLLPALRNIGALVDACANHTLVIETKTNVADTDHYGADPASFLDYERHWREQDPRFACAVRSFGSVLSDVAVIDPDEFERSAIYNEHIAPADIRYTLFGTFSVAPGVLLGSAFLRPRRRGAFAEEEIRRLSAVVPHLVRTVRLRRTMDTLRSELADLRRALDAVVMATMVLDANARIVCANRTAEELLAARDGLRCDSGRLTASLVSERSALERAIAKASANAEPHALRPGTPHLVPSAKITRSDGAVLSVVLFPLRARNEIRRQATTRARVLAMVHDPTRVVRVDRALVAELHGLTATEAELAATLAEGRTLAEFAAARGSSEQTARTHLKRILEKTQTGRQAELVRLILTGAAMHALR